MTETASPPVVKRPALKYFGSKWRMAGKIIELLGASHDAYVEPYGGSGAVLLQKPRVDIEVMNDLNQDVVTFFRVLRDRPLELLQQIELTPFARYEYLASTKVPEDATDLDRARLFFVRSWQGFSGSATQKRNGWRYQSRVYGNRLTKVDLDWHALDRLEEASVRLRQVQIEMDDALSIIKRFDSPTAAFYVESSLSLVDQVEAVEQKRLPARTDDAGPYPPHQPSKKSGGASRVKLLRKRALFPDARRLGETRNKDRQ